MRNIAKKFRQGWVLTWYFLRVYPAGAFYAANPNFYLGVSMVIEVWVLAYPGLFSDAESCEDSSEDIFGYDLATDCTNLRKCFAKFDSC